MTTSHQALLDKRAQAWTAATAILDTAADEGRELTADERSAYDAADAEVDKFDADIARFEKHAKRSAAGGFDDEPANLPETPEQRVGGAPADEYRAAFSAFLRGGAGQLDAEQRKVLTRGLVNDPEMRAQAVGTNSAGGYLVPPGYRQEFIKTMKDYGAVQDVAQVITTDTGASVQWPTLNDTASVGALLAENTQMAELDLAVGTATLDAYMYTSKLTRASYQLVQDSAFDVESTVRDAHAERIGRILNQHLTTGTGSSQPDGIVTSATSGVTAAGVAAITADELIDLIHSVDPAYRRNNGRFMLSDTALKTIRKLKDSDGQYLWQPGLSQGVPDSILGYGYVVNQDMAVPAAGVKSVLFGDFEKGYVVRLVSGIQVITFNERYADYLQVAWASYLRADGTLQNAAAYKALTQAAS